MFWEERRSNEHFDNYLGRTMREKILPKDGQRRTYVPLPAPKQTRFPSPGYPHFHPVPFFLGYQSSSFVITMLRLHVLRDLIQFSLSLRDSPLNEI